MRTIILVGVGVLITLAGVVAVDVGRALVTAWRAFRRATGDDIAGWDTGDASAEVWPKAGPVRDSG